MKKIILLTLATLMMVGCEQYVARQVGGTLTIKLESGQKLLEATWKESDLWYLTEPMDSEWQISLQRSYRKDMLPVVWVSGIL